MKLISHKIFLKHNDAGHPENADRIRKALKQFMYEDAKDGEQYLNKIHTNRYINKVKTLLNDMNIPVAFLDAGETYVCKDTYKAACFAVGAAVQAAEYARNKKPAFALVRPPGHHAHPDWTNGFCIFNNIAIAAAYLAEKKEKVLIVDIDMHRGDGTHDCVRKFNDDLYNRLYYFSINQQGVFPGMTFDEGNVKNVYLPAGTSEDEYIAVLDKELPSLIRSFKPTIIAISAGFDSFATDKASHCESIGCGLSLTKKTINELKRLVGNIPYFAVLEGGYNPDSIVEGVGAFMRKGTSAVNKKGAAGKSSKGPIAKKPLAKKRLTGKGAKAAAKKATKPKVKKAKAAKSKSRAKASKKKTRKR